MRALDLRLKPEKGFFPTVGLIYSMLRLNREILKRKVAGLKPGHLAWQPDKYTNTIGTLLLHIAEAELWWMQEVIEGIPLTKKEKEEFRYEIYGSPQASPVERNELKFFLGKLDKVRAKTKKILQRLKDKDLERVHRDSQKRLSNGWILYHLIEHEASHTGQIASLKNRMKHLNLI